MVGMLNGRAVAVRALASVQPSIEHLLASYVFVLRVHQYTSAVTILCRYSDISSLMSEAEVEKRLLHLPALETQGMKLFDT